MSIQSNNKSRYSISIDIRSYRTKKPFIIARGEKSQADQIIVTLSKGHHHGIGTCVPYPRYGETIQSVCGQIEAVKHILESGIDIEALQSLMPAGAARNAVDCALWDLQAKLSATPVWALCGLPEPKNQITATTLSIATPNKMGAQAYELRGAPLLKLKLAGDQQDLARIIQTHKNAPKAKLILDANEALSRTQLDQLMDNIPIQAIALIEQPVKSEADETLQLYPHKNLLCADESFHVADDISTLTAFYGAINIKLDKSGGLTEALKSARLAKTQGLNLMIGCMLGSSLAMAPAFLLAPLAQIIDLDGPLLLAEDDADGFTFDATIMKPSQLWGYP